MNLFIKFFDFIKRLNMDKLYRKANPWGRNDYIGDIDSAVSLVSDQRYENCLDVGTGLGHYAERAAKFCDNVLAIDISPLAIDRAKSRLSNAPNITFKTANIRDFDTKTQFDLIILGDILYYLGDMRFPIEFNTLGKHIASLIAPRGHILMSNFVSPNRTESSFTGYVSLFASEGFALKTQKIFKDKGRQWVQVVLGKMNH